MRVILVLLGAAAIAAYAVLGAICMTVWEVVAGSGLPLKDTVAAMHAADQPYSIMPGVVFAVLGIALAAAWSWLALRAGDRHSPWWAVAVWAAIIAFGAPAYWWGSFGNMMSVGDTFGEWHPDAAWAAATPLYACSGIALLIGIAALPLAIVSTAHRAASP